MKNLTTLIAVMIFCTTLYSQQIENASFENWEDIGIGTDEPVNWSSIKTSDNIVLNPLAPIVWGISDDAHTGNHSLKLFNVYNSLIQKAATGTITNGRAHAELITENAYVFTDSTDPQWNSTINSRPDSLVGWFKCKPTSGDFGTVKFMLHNNEGKLPGTEEQAVAMAYFELPGVEISQWTRFSVPFEYNSSEMPKYYLSVITSGNGTEALANSEALFDDFKFIYNGSSINELSASKIIITTNNNTLSATVNSNKSNAYNFKLTSVTGKVNIKGQLFSGQNSTFDISNLPPGIYIATIFNNKSVFSKKLVIR